MCILSRVFKFLSVCSLNVILVGDFNVHFQDPRDVDARELNGFLREYGLSSDFSAPTRFASCLDNSFSNTQVPLRTATVGCTFSDHKGLESAYYIRSLGVNDLDDRFVRPTTQCGLLLFYQLVQEINFQFVYSDDLSAGGAADVLIETLSSLASAAFPIRRVSCMGRNSLHISWFTPSLRKLREELHSLSDFYHATKDTDIHLRLKQLRARYRNELVEAKRRANENYIRSHSNSSSAIWRVIRKNSTAPSVAGSSSGLSANQFNVFFLGVPDKVMSSLPPTACDPISLSSWVDHDDSRGRYFKFQPVSQVEMRSAIMSIKSTKSMDYFGLNAIMLKHIVNLVTGPLTKLFNRCVMESTFPNILKIASVLPIHKKGKIDDVNNYRPISILPVIGKVFERLLSGQLFNYLELNKILHPNQHGFRLGRSTNTAAAAFVDRIVGHFERKEYCEVSLLDLSKAFDCVSHVILLRKLYMYNLLPCACGMLSSYMSNRKQCVRYKMEISELGVLTAGVAQGSIIGPLMFLLFINDFPNAFSTHETLLYADDTTIFSAGAGSECAVRACAEKMEVARRWFDANRLSLNNEKTLNLTFTLLRNPDSRRSSKFLGLHIDTELTWQFHCDDLILRLNSFCFALRRLSESVSLDVLRSAYFGLFHSHLSYGILLWGHSASARRVFAVQRRAIRVLDDLGYREDCRRSFASRNVLTLPSLYIYECLKYVIHRKDELTRHNMIHEHDTRGRTNIVGNALRLTRSRNSANYYGIKLYNAISMGVRGLQNDFFLRNVKKYLLGAAFYSMDEFFQNPP